MTDVDESASAVSAAEARRSHSFLSALRSGVEVWYAVLGGIAAWTVHLLFFASFVRYTCTTHRYVWVMHLATVVLAAATLFAMYLCSRLMSRAGDPLEGDAGADEGSVFAFLGRFGLILNAFNLALILLEEVMINAFGPRRCV